MEQPEKMNQDTEKKSNNQKRNRHRKRKTTKKSTVKIENNVTVAENLSNTTGTSVSSSPITVEPTNVANIEPVISQSSENINREIKPETQISIIASVKSNVGVVHVVKPQTDIKMEVKTEKTREEIMAEREAKKAAKLAAKTKGKTNVNTDVLVDKTQSNAKTNETSQEKVSKVNKTDTPAAAESKPKKPVVVEKIIIPEKPKIDSKTTKPSPAVGKSPITKSPSTETELSEKMEKLKISESEKLNQKTSTTKAERRAQQEAQRAAKAKSVTEKQSSQSDMKTKVSKSAVKSSDKPVDTPSKKSLSVSSTKLKAIGHRVKLFNHLYTDQFSFDKYIDTTNIHPSIIKLGLQYANGIVVGSNARCMAFLNAMKIVIKDYKTPVQQDFKRGLESQIKPSIEFLQKCRPLSVSVINSLKYIKAHITQLETKSSDVDQKDFLLDLIDTYIRDQIEKAAQAISISVQEKISNGDVILTYGCSSLVKHILEEANRRKVDFRVIVVDSRPKHEGQEMLRRLVSQGINCTCVLINAIGFIMPEVTKVLLGAHALLANGYVTSRVGTAQIALVAKSYNVPVLVCCETHKFSERVQTDAFVYNELGDPNDLILKSGTLENKNKNPLADWASIPSLTPLNLYYDITPPELVTAVVTEVAILPCTSVPVILRIKPSEIGY